MSREKYTFLARMLPSLSFGLLKEGKKTLFSKSLCDVKENSNARPSETFKETRPLTKPAPLSIFYSLLLRIRETIVGDKVFVLTPSKIHYVLEEGRNYLRQASKKTFDRCVAGTRMFVFCPSTSTTAPIPGYELIYPPESHPLYLSPIVIKCLNKSSFPVMECMCILAMVTRVRPVNPLPSLWPPSPPSKSKNPYGLGCDG
ncbi:hypothetical protein CEXT_372981 [Caerostris extrusa]|uniref:Uncharacterized protein n=1 Tax=Caerostris extrusa TaxID=172846 RepID=A0AAV4UBF9_CAEEX|nr:hypothetical protein CEXT_372981 [Caerostris extrusa]